MKLRPRTWQSALVSGALALSLSVGAQPLDERMKKVLADPAATAAAMTAAKKVTFFCDGCHGGDGNSVTSDVPNLAGQHPNYLLTQIDKFAKGQRRSKFMEGLMKVLSEDDRINTTIYYSSKAVRPSGVGSSTAGQSLYQQRCLACHDAQGRGSETTPRVAGQQIEYLMQSMTRYRDRSGERIYAPMAASTAGLKDQEIMALAIYLSSLH
jgi:cytochrome c553